MTISLPRPSCKDRYAHLRANAAVQKRRTVERLEQAIITLEAAGRPVTTFTIKEVCGLDYMAYYRNPEALILFRKHSTYLQKAQAKGKAKHRLTKNKRGKEISKEERSELQGTMLTGEHSRKVTKRQSVGAVDDQWERKYQALLQEHMQCGLTIARLEAQVAQYLEMMEGFRASLKQEEYDVGR